MTNLIPDSWELPSYLAGDLVDMERFRHRKQQAQRGAELYSQDALDALEGAGFEPQEPGVWRRRVVDDEGEHLGPSHVLTYNPGHRRPTDGSRAPWHLMTEPTTTSVAFRALTGDRGALAAADEDREQIRRIPKNAGLYLLALTKVAAGQSAGRQNADDWLAANPEESFEHDPREEARRWMDDHAHEYDAWNPEPSDYTYEDFGDAAGQSFHGDEAQSHVLPSSAYRSEGDSGISNDGWEAGGLYPETRRTHDHDDDDAEPEPDPDNEALSNHGFNWESDDPDEEAFHNPVIDGPDYGKYVRHQHDLNGNHIATHTLSQGRDGSWNLKSSSMPSDTNHHNLDFALYKYKQNSAEALLPKHGYEPFMGRANGVSHWVKTDPSPEGSDRSEDYRHEVIFPENGFMGHTKQNTRLPNGIHFHSSDDLADVVREQQRLAQGRHPGGRLDHRLTRDDLLNDPTVARLGQPSGLNEGDGRVSRASWHIPHPHASHDVHAETVYNWDKGGYDFRYTYDGVPLAATHNYVPEGAPVHVPGRQPSLF